MEKQQGESRFRVALVGAEIDTVPGWVVGGLAKHGIDLFVTTCEVPADVPDQAGDSDIIWVAGGSELVTADILDELPRCGAIIRTGSGTDNIPVVEATKLGIVVANTPEAHSEEVSDHTIGLLLAVVRHIASDDRIVRGGGWDPRPHLPRPLTRGSTLGLIGFGHIGRLVAQKLGGFEMTILAHDPYVSDETCLAYDVTPVGLDEILARSDFVSLNCPLTSETRGLIGRRELNLMKPEAILINTARGGVVVESDLVTALEEGWIAGAGLDVFDPEPPGPDHPLLELDNVVMTSHAAGYSTHYLETAWRLSVDTVLDLAKGRWPASYVNHDVEPRWSLQ